MIDLNPIVMGILLTFGLVGVVILTFSLSVNIIGKIMDEE